jgi:hypothetical protein
MATAPVKSIPQPLGGIEIKKGIAVRMTQGLPADVAEPLREQIIAGLGKTCSLMANAAYAKFKATWRLAWWRRVPHLLECGWWVDYELNDFGRVTRGGIGGGSWGDIPNGATKLSGVIEEAPPDRFRRETDQPIPKPTEIKPPEPEKSTFSRSTRGNGRRRQV